MRLPERLKVPANHGLALPRLAFDALVFALTLDRLCKSYVLWSFPS